jgi:hypothetical protein
VHILFIGISFYDYDQAIANELRQRGFRVDYFSETPRSRAFHYYVKTGNQKQIDRIAARKAKGIARACSSSYDVVLIIKCQYLTAEALEQIRKKNPRARRILYLWDSLVRIPGIREKMSFFDEVWSFDRTDCLREKNLTFNPLFFRREFDLPPLQGPAVFDLTFVGWYHSDRPGIIDRVYDFCRQQDLKYNIRLTVSRLDYLRDWILNGELKRKKELLQFSPLSISQYTVMLKQTAIVLDIAHPRQSGLTIRTIETLGAQRRLITTNADVVNYDFYRPENICIVDRESPVIPPGFFRGAYEPLPANLRERYSLAAWLERMIPYTS